MTRACLLLGSNIHPEHNLARSVNELRAWVRLKQVSQVYETPAVGSDGPNFLNAAIRIETTLAASTLKDQVLRPLEARLGRVRSADKNAPRPIDLDIIVWDDVLLDPALGKYAHLAVPMAELLPALRLPPGEETLAEISRRIANQASIQLRADVFLLAQPPNP